MESDPKGVEEVLGSTIPKPPTAAQQNWGAVMSIIIIVCMIVIGAFYAWGERLAKQPSYPSSLESGSVVDVAE